MSSLSGPNKATATALKKLAKINGIPFGTLPLLGVVLLSMALPAGLSAKTYTVNSTGDSALGDPGNCKRPAGTCSLRDALAAADQSPNHDKIGIFTGNTVEAPYTSGNVFQANEILGNSPPDVVDLDPVCNDTWVENLFETAYAASGVCIE